MEGKNPFRFIEIPEDLTCSEHLLQPITWYCDEQSRFGCDTCKQNGSEMNLPGNFGGPLAIAKVQKEIQTSASLESISQDVCCSNDGSPICEACILSQGVTECRGPISKTPSLTPDTLELLGIATTNEGRFPHSHSLKFVLCMFIV